jgi:hypothetical protein
MEYSANLTLFEEGYSAQDASKGCGEWLLNWRQIVTSSFPVSRIRRITCCSKNAGGVGMVGQV